MGRGGKEGGRRSRGRGSSFMEGQTPEEEELGPLFPGERGTSQGEAFCGDTQGDHRLQNEWEWGGAFGGGNLWRREEPPHWAGGPFSGEHRAEPKARRPLSGDSPASQTQFRLPAPLLAVLRSQRRPRWSSDQQQAERKRADRQRHCHVPPERVTSHAATLAGPRRPRPLPPQRRLRSLLGGGASVARQRREAAPLLLGDERAGRV